MSRDGATNEGRRAAARALEDLMREKKLWPADVAKLAKLSENTVRDLMKGNKQQNISSWDLTSKALGCGDDLINILHGKADAIAPVKSPMERQLAQLVEEMAQLGALREDVAVLKDVIQRIDEKIDLIIEDRKDLAEPGPLERHE